MPYGRLEPFTELVVTPKKHASHLKGLPHSRFDSPPAPAAPPQTVSPPGQQWGGIADLKSLFGYMTKGTRDPLKEVPSVPEVPTALADALYRVCGSPPLSLADASRVAPGVLHVFPLGDASNFDIAEAQPEVTYGLLSKVPSPTERARVEKKKKNAAGDGGAEAKGQEAKGQEATVVRLVCHGTDMQRRHTEGSIHCGRVWVRPTKIIQGARPHSFSPCILIFNFWTRFLQSWLSGSTSRHIQQ